MTGQAASFGDGPDAGSFAWLKPPTVLRALVVGPGRVARALARDLYDNESHGLSPVAVIDDVINNDNTDNSSNTDDTDDTGADDLTQLTHLIAEHAAEAVVLAIPALPTRRFRALADAARHAGAVVRYLPWYATALPREATGSDLRPLDVRALVDGPAPRAVPPEVKEIVAGKRVLVTGAAGPLGSELCRQLHAFDPGALFLLDGDAPGSDGQALRRLRTDVCGDELTIDLHDRDETVDAFGRLKPEVVFHAAGLRQAPLLERRPSLGVKANIRTTDNLVRAAARHGTERFIRLSADADPASMLEACHRTAEAIILSAAHAGHKAGKKHRTAAVFAAVRVGDVLDPRGDSLLTSLADQIRAGGPVTVTHPGAARVFATVEEAVALALEAGRMAVGGEVYSLDLGEPTPITDVITRFTRQYRLPEVPIRYVGTRPSHSKNPAPADRTPTAHPQIFTLPTNADPAQYAHLPERLDKLYKAAAKNRDPKVRQMLASRLNRSVDRH